MWPPQQTPSMMSWVRTAAFTKPRNLLCIVFVITISLSRQVRAQDSAILTMDSRLREKLFTNYNPKTWPHYYANGTKAMVKVELDAPLRQIITMIEKEQYIITYLWLTIKWRLETLQWNPAAYGGLDMIAVDPTKIWVPDVYMENDVRDYDRDTSRYDALLSSDGNVHWSYPMIYKSTCTVDVSHYPFDTQICKLSFGSWTYNSSEMCLRPLTKNVDRKNYVHNSEWRLLNMTVRRLQLGYSSLGTYDAVVYSVQMERMPMFHIVNLVVPCIIIVFLGYTGFMIPSTSGEKISLFITTLLTLTVFLQLVSDTLPPQSMSVPLISIFFGGTIVLLSLSCVAAVLVENIHFRGQLTRDLPQWVVRLLSIRWLCVLFLPSMAVKKVHLLHKHRQESEQKDSAMRMEFVLLGWSLVAVMLDRLFLTFFVSITLLFLGVLFSLTRNFIAIQEDYRDNEM